jgi:hypothetical protein
MTIYAFENQDQAELEANFKFQPLSFSWVAIHPKPKGIVQFIGGALFGTFPTIFYDFFLRRLFAEGYTIIALPFKFTFDHWSVSLQLLREQYVARKALIEEVKRLQYDTKIYLEDQNYRWVGHSLGCKYIILLELLSTFEDLSIVAPEQQTLIDDSAWEKIWQEYKPKIKSSQESQAKIEKQLNNLKDKVKNIYDEWLKIRKAIAKLVEEEVDLKGLFIRDQPSLLIAPDISDTSSAVPIASVAKFMDRLGLGAKPTKAQTQSLVGGSSVFFLTSMIAFERDMIAGNLANSTGDSDVAWLATVLNDRGGSSRIKEIPNTYHLEPHGHQNGDFVVDFPGSIIVWSTGLAFAPLSPFSPPAKAFFNEVRKPILKSLADREILEKTVLNLL